MITDVKLRAIEEQAKNTRPLYPPTSRGSRILCGDDLLAYVSVADGVEVAARRAAFLAGTWADMPRLCAEVRRLRAQVKKYRDWLGMVDEELPPCQSVEKALRSPGPPAGPPPSPPKSEVTPEQMAAWRREVKFWKGPDYEKSHDDATAALAKLDDMLLATDVEENK